MNVQEQPATFKAISPVFHNKCVSIRSRITVDEQEVSYVRCNAQVYVEIDEKEFVISERASGFTVPKGRVYNARLKYDSDYGIFYTEAYHDTLGSGGVQGVVMEEYKCILNDKYKNGLVIARAGSKSFVFNTGGLLLDEIDINGVRNSFSTDAFLVPVHEDGVQYSVRSAFTVENYLFIFTVIAGSDLSCCNVYNFTESGMLKRMIPEDLLA